MKRRHFCVMCAKPAKLLVSDPSVSGYAEIPSKYVCSIHCGRDYQVYLEKLAASTATKAAQVRARLDDADMRIAALTDAGMHAVVVKLPSTLMRDGDSVKIEWSEKVWKY